MKNKYADMSADELRGEENQLRTDMFNLRLQNTTKELENTSRLRGTRRDLARVMTALAQRENEAAKAKPADPVRP